MATVYVLLEEISFSFFNWRPIILGFTGPIFTIFFHHVVVQGTLP